MGDTKMPRMPLAGQRDFTIPIPPELVKEFGKDLRVVIRHPWIIGIPVPQRLLGQEALKDLLKEHDLMLVPKGLKEL